MKNKFIGWLKIKSKEERKEYISELTRSATKEDYKYWGIYSCAAIGYSFSIINLITIFKHFAYGNYISWFAIIVAQLFALAVLWLHRYLTRPSNNAT